MAEKVLIVDDVPFMRLMQRDILIRNGYEIAGEAADGEDAVAKYKELHPDVVLLDINMPKKNGIEALVEILEYDNDAICIICTDISQQEMLHQAIEYGAREFITKPFTVDKVIKAIRKQLDSKTGTIRDYGQQNDR